MDPVVVWAPRSPAVGGSRSRLAGGRTDGPDVWVTQAAVGRQLCQARAVEIGIVGGTGPAGSALGARWAAAGAEVRIGSRRSERAAETVRSLQQLWGQRVASLHAATNEEAASAEVVVVATPWDAVVATMTPLASVCAGRPVVCIANALVPVGAELQPLVLARGSVSASLAAALPGSPVAAAFQHLPAHDLGRLDAELDADVLVAADDRRAFEVAEALVRSVPNLRALEAGSLGLAGPIEAMTAVLVSVNRRYRTRTALKLTGIPESPDAPRRPVTGLRGASESE